MKCLKCIYDTQENEKSLEEESREYKKIISEGEDNESEGTDELPESFTPPMLLFIPGKDRAEYRKHGAFCIQPQNYPNAVNHVGFILHPDDFKLNFRGQRNASSN